MNILGDISLDDPDIAILEIERRIKHEVLRNGYNYVRTDELFWNPIAHVILENMKNNASFANVYINVIDAAIGNNSSYNKNNLPMEILLNGILDKQFKMFNFPRYIAAANIYAPNNKKLPHPSPAAVTQVIMDNIVDVEEERNIVMKTLAFLGSTKPPRKDLTIPHVLLGLGELVGSKAFPPSTFEQLIEQINILLNLHIEKAKDFEELADKSSSRILVVNAGYNLKSQETLITYNPSIIGKISEKGAQSMTKEIVEESRVLSFPITELTPTKKPFDEYGIGDRIFVIMDYRIVSNRYLILGLKKETTWDPIIKSFKSPFKLDKPTTTKLWDIANEIIEIIKHMNFIEEEVVDEELDLKISDVVANFQATVKTITEENIKSFLRNMLDWDVLSILEKARINGIILELSDSVLSDMTNEIEPFSSIGSSRLLLYKFMSHAIKRLKVGGRKIHRAPTLHTRLLQILAPAETVITNYPDMTKIFPDATINKPSGNVVDYLIRNTPTADLLFMRVKHSIKESKGIVWSLESFTERIFELCNIKHIAILSDDKLNEDSIEISGEGFITYIHKKE